MVRFAVATALTLLIAAQPASAGDRRAGGKLLLTNGVTSVEGAAGGGLASWAVIAGNETRDGIGGKVNATIVTLPDFDLESFGGAIGVNDRLELSYTHQSFDTRAAGVALRLGRGFTFKQEIYGAKLRLFGDAVWDQDSWLPQVAIGAQHKRATRGAVIRAVGGKGDRGTDFYVAATKVVLSRSVVVNGTVRFTKANQFGLLGFGGDRYDRRRPQFEGSAAIMLSPRFVLGVEGRTKPNNLGFAREQKAVDGFAAWAVTRNLSLTAAYVDLGDIATVRRQRGAFLSAQGSF
ncbi:Protein of unknown function [Sphingomonas guangdongensis]|uniref:DUF3034 domain-containing protein n=1 Tax=Sphingomonas guangdongensis TaxID=1141890 RepID=A0A285R1X0_9SPHN|nr:DUF3034 family protein [Sphingomonas guangdongensis]SOB86367.1 Protein of unknown function [Sphingomonas guangdongensis]